MKLPDEPPLISIVTPSFQQGAFLERTIQSVLTQGYRPLEYILQDGGSQDGTSDLLERYQCQFRHCESAPDRGQADAINRGMSRASGEILGYLNSDDLLLPGALHHVANFFSMHRDVDVVYGHRRIIDVDDREIGHWVLPPHDDEVLSWADFIPQETLFWRRRVWEEVGGFVDESLRFAMDWDLILRFRDAGARFVRLPCFLGAFRVHPAQKTEGTLSILGEREMFRLRRRCLGRDVDYDEINRAIRPYLLRHVLYENLYRLGFLAR